MGFPSCNPGSAGVYCPRHAGVMELADVTDSKSVGLITRAGSTPATGTKEKGMPPTGHSLLFAYHAGVERARE